MFGLSLGRGLPGRRSWAEYFGDCHDMTRQLAAVTLALVVLAACAPTRAINCTDFQPSAIRALTFDVFAALMNSPQSLLVRADRVAGSSRGCRGSCFPGHPVPTVPVE